MVKFFKVGDVRLCLYEMDTREAVDKTVRVDKIEKLIRAKSECPVKVYYSPSGKPLVRGKGAISISHKNDLLFFAWTKEDGYCLGCDLETLENKVDWQLFEKHYFSVRELDLAKGRFKSKEEAGFSLFSAKEAAFKAVGEEVEVSFLEQAKGRTFWTINQDGKVYLSTYVIKQLVFSLCVMKTKLL